MKPPCTLRLIAMLAGLLALTGCTTDYILPPKAIIVPVETEGLRKAADEQGRKLSETGEAGRNAGKSLVRIASASEDLAQMASVVLAGDGSAETKGFAGKFLGGVFRLQDQVTLAQKEAEDYRIRFDDLQSHFEQKVNPEVGKVVVAAAVNREQAKHADKVDTVLRKEAVEGLEAKKDLVKEEKRHIKTDVWKSVWKRGALILGGLIFLVLLIKLFGAAIWRWIKAHNPFSY